MSHLKRLLSRDNANLLAVLIDQPNRGNADIFIDSGPRSAELRLAAKKSSSYIFCVMNYFFPKLSF
jgi:hypothetical protein